MWSYLTSSYHTSKTRALCLQATGKWKKKLKCCNEFILGILYSIVNGVSGWPCRGFLGAYKWSYLWIMNFQSKYNVFDRAWNVFTYLKAIEHYWNKGFQELKSFTRMFLLNQDNDETENFRCSLIFWNNLWSKEFQFSML